MIMIITENSMW